MLVNAIDPIKDVDGFHTNSTGRLYTYQSSLIPCTPQGCMMLHLKDNTERSFGFECCNCWKVKYCW